MKRSLQFATIGVAPLLQVWQQVLARGRQWGETAGWLLRTFWPLWLSMLLIAVVALVGLAPGLERLGERWAFTYKHGYLLLGMGGWLTLRAFAAAPVARVAPFWPGLMLLAAGVCVYTVAELLDFTLGMQLVLPALLWVLLLALAGPEVGQRTLLPVLLIYFAIPVWDLAVIPLQEASTWAVTWALGFAGIPVFVDGHLVHIAAGTFEIAEGCSGQRYLIVALALAAFYGFAWYQRWWMRICLLLVAALLSMLSNWVRIYLLIMLGHVTEMQHPLIAEHDEFGWIVFLVAMVPLFWFARWLELRDRHASVVRASSAPGRGSVVAFLVAGVLAATVLGAPALVRVDTTPPLQPAVVDLTQATPAGGWTVTQDPPWHPQFERAHEEGLVTLTQAAGPPVTLYLARYRYQHADSKLIWNRNTLSGDWHRARTGSVVGAWEGQEYRLRELELVAGGERRLVWTWYRIGGLATHDRQRAKMLELLVLLRGRRDGAVAALSVPCDVSCREARDALHVSLALLGPGLDVIAMGKSEGVENASRDLFSAR